MKDELQRLIDYAKKLKNQMWSIYNEYGTLECNGKYYDKYHDAMLTQCQGANMDYVDSEFYVLSDWGKNLCIKSFEDLIKRYEKCMNGLEAMKDAHVAMADADTWKPEIVDNLIYG